MHTAIVAAAGPQDISAVRELFVEYADWLGEDLCFQGLRGTRWSAVLSGMTRFLEAWKAPFTLEG